MSDEAKGKAYLEERQRRFAFLDKRIPELHAMGKPTEELPADATKGERVGRSHLNLELATYPGRAARTQAEKEYAAKRAA